VLADPSRGISYVAEEGVEIVVQVMITTEWSDWRNGWFWWVQSVYVRSGARRRGVFRALFQEVRRQAEADPGVIGLRLYVERDNLRARQTYQALGLAEEPYLLMGLYPLPGKRSVFSPDEP
jgi:GNAT superfamily N-acetyltransferase